MSRAQDRKRREAEEILRRQSATKPVKYAALCEYPVNLVYHKSWHTINAADVGDAKEKALAILREAESTGEEGARIVFLGENMLGEPLTLPKPKSS